MVTKTKNMIIHCTQLVLKPKRPVTRGVGLILLFIVNFCLQLSLLKLLYQDTTRYCQMQVISTNTFQEWPNYLVKPLPHIGDYMKSILLEVPTVILQLCRFPVSPAPAPAPNHAIFSGIHINTNYSQENSLKIKGP